MKGKTKVIALLVITMSVMSALPGCATKPKDKPVSVTNKETEVAVREDSGGVTRPADFVKIPGGTFTMGSPADEAERFDWEGPQHEVTVGTFYLGKHEVTVGEFRQFVNDTGYKTTAETGGGGYVFTGGKLEEKADASWRNPYFSQTGREPEGRINPRVPDKRDKCKLGPERQRLPAAHGSGMGIRLPRRDGGPVQHGKQHNDGSGKL
jgi:formylglycine-generating enzyme required for sulfatase activity